MEGLAGVVGSRDKELVRNMLRRLVHRGPDAIRIHEDDALTLGARAMRIGQETGCLAIAEEDGFAVACDSYLFNKEELCRTYLGETCPHASDAELLLAMYRKDGPRAFGLLDGAFAAAVSSKGRLTLARDRYGLKPLYISRGKGATVFSSEMKSQILAEEDFIPFPPGKVRLPSGKFVPVRIRLRGSRLRSRTHVTPKDIRRAVIESVRQLGIQRESFNILLSGGIDSSAVAAAAAQVADSLRSVCVGLESGADLPTARRVAEYLGIDHMEYVFDVEEMIEKLDEVIYAAESFDYPLIRSCIPNYMATHLLEGGKKPTLCGEGGDEIFAGYDYMRELRSEKGLRRERMKLLKSSHLTGFQRVDRMTASARLEGLMPLMSATVVQLGLSLRRPQLIGPRNEDTKLALRMAFKDLLPAEVISRRKQRFSDGAGSMYALVGFAERLISDREFERETARLPKGRIRTKEELLYYKVFAEHFDSPSAIAAVGFTPRP